MNPTDVLDYEVLDNAVLTWLTSIGVFVGIWLLLAIARRLLVNRLRTLAQGTNVAALYIVDRVVARTQVWFPLLLALFVSSRLLASTPALTAVFRVAFTISLLLQIGLWATAALSAWLKVRRQRLLKDNPGEVAATDFLQFALSFCVWVVITLMMLDNLGVNVTTLIAGLGIGGVAVALAAQNVLADLFASLAIVLDRPFRVGDALVIDEFNGNVERVGLKTTRLRSLSGEQLVFSNTDLLSSRIRNFGRMAQRRVAFQISVTYRTRASDLRRIPALIRSVIETEKDVHFDRAHFSRYGDFALIFEVVYHVLSPDGNVHMDVQHRINLGLYERFAAEGIEFAYPTQTLYVPGLTEQLARVQADQAGRPRRSLDGPRRE